MTFWVKSYNHTNLKNKLYIKFNYATLLQVCGMELTLNMNTHKTQYELRSSSNFTSISEDFFFLDINFFNISF
jgi:hypothetical protein